jgi:hypothetical protein
VKYRRYNRKIIDKWSKAGMAKQRQSWINKFFKNWSSNYFFSVWLFVRRQSELQIKNRTGRFAELKVIHLNEERPILTEWSLHWSRPTVLLFGMTEKLNQRKKGLTQGLLTRPILYSNAIWIRIMLLKFVTI